MRIAMISAVALALATPAAAFEFERVVTPCEAMVEYPYAVLGLQPGATFEEIEAVASRKGISIRERPGTVLADNTRSRIAIDVTLGFGPREDVVAVRRLEPGRDEMFGRLGTGAIGNVATTIGRVLSLDVVEAPGRGAVLKQMVASYGAPSLIEARASRMTAVWVNDTDGKHISHETLGTSITPGSWSFPTDLLKMPRGCLGIGFDYVSPAQVNTRCSAVFTLIHERTSDAVLIYTILTDVMLRDCDRIEASRQINAELGREKVASDIEF